MMKDMEDKSYSGISKILRLHSLPNKNLEFFINLTVLTQFDNTDQKP